VFARERALFESVFPAASVEVEHIGSTAVPGLAAKPIIDMLVGVASLAQVESRVRLLAQLGFVYVSKHELVLPQRRFFTRSELGERICHVHAVVRGTPFWFEHLAFRDALCQSKALSENYAELKRELAAKFPFDREAYTDAKAPFIAAVLASLGQR
jgi:GrpB-like predicted nucleotidyltransferase (UPF0157 family)